MAFSSKTLRRQLAALAVIAVPFCTMHVAAQPGGTIPAQKLSAAGLDEAKRAEALVRQQQIPQAIAAYQALEAKFPAVPAITLRLAQLYDNSSQYGPALYYYRKHLLQSPQRTLEEATARVTALELMPTVSEGAAAFAQKIGARTERVATPAPVEEHQITVAREDGSLVPIRTEEEWKEFNEQGKTRATPIPRTQSTPLTIALPKNEEVRAPRAQTPSASEVAASPTSTGPASVYAAETPRPADEDALLVRSLVSPTPVPTQAPVLEHLQEIPAVPALTPSAPEDFVPDFSQVTAPPGRPVEPQVTRPVTPRQTPSRRVAFIDPEPATDDPQAAKFFRITPDPSGRTALQISNMVEDSVLTIQAFPKDQSEPVQVIMAAPEDRNIQLPPGTYQVTVNLTTTNYPPQPLFKTSFTYRFDKGQQYGRRFTKENLQAF